MVRRGLKWRIDALISRYADVVRSSGDEGSARAAQIASKAHFQSAHPGGIVPPASACQYGRRLTAAISTTGSKGRREAASSENQVMIDGNQHHARVAHMVGALSLVLSLASNVSPQERASDPSRAAFMKAHFSEAIVMHDAVARGDLPAAHAQATRLAQHRPAVPFPTGAHVFFGLMTIDAGKVRSANTVEEAGHAASMPALALRRVPQGHARCQCGRADTRPPDRWRRGANAYASTRDGSRCWKV